MSDNNKNKNNNLLAQPMMYLSDKQPSMMAGMQVAG